MTTDSDKAYAVRTHLLYELKWMVYAAARFEKEPPSLLDVSLIDSAAVHARNLFEFASEQGGRKKPLTLRQLGGESRDSGDWGRWLNNRVTHMLQRESRKEPWPGGLNNDQRDRLSVMAGAALSRLEEGGASIPSGPVREAFFEVVDAARQYWSDPSDDTHQKLADLYDDSRDDDAEPY